MSNIKLEDLNEQHTVTDSEAADVKGGPIFMEYDGIRGDVTAEGYAHTGGVNFLFGDGSVRAVKR